MKGTRAAHPTSAILFALALPLPVYAVSGSFFIVLNERLLRDHVFDASRTVLAPWRGQPIRASRSRTRASTWSTMRRTVSRS